MPLDEFHGSDELWVPSKKVLANILLEGFGEEYEGESLLKSSEFGDGAYTDEGRPGGTLRTFFVWRGSSGGSGRERLLGLAAVKEKKGVADFPDVVTELGLANPMSVLKED